MSASVRRVLAARRAGRANARVARRLTGLAVALLATAGLAAGQAPATEQATTTNTENAVEEDPYLWLEDIDGRKALQWVKARNRATMRTLASKSSFKRLRERLLEVFDSEDRIPSIGKLGDRYYNFWRDKDHPRGLLRRTSLEQYRLDEPDWEPVLDLDRLARKERENWVLNGYHCRQPKHDRCLVRLSRGGADAVVTREFDLRRKRFVKPEDGGFFLLEAKGSADWAAQDALFVATDFGPGTMTSSGYPRIVKLWQRGQPLEEAQVVFEGEASDVSVGAYADLATGYELRLVWRGIDFYNRRLFVYDDGELTPLNVPTDASPSMHRGRMFVELKSDWRSAGRVYRAGSLLATPLADFLKGKRNFHVLYEPVPGTSLASFAPTRNHVLINVLDNVRNRIELATPMADGWTQKPLFANGEDGYRTVSVWPVEADEDDRYFVDATDYLTPPTLSLGTVGEEPTPLKRSPGYFDAEGLAIAQHWATSKDGTRIPYFQVGQAGTTPAADAAQPGPTLLYGYGGFEIAQLPRYSAGVGIGWLERGGTYVVANIRGGGEFGPDWHQAALRANRHLAYDDFIAVAEHLLQRGATTPAQLGILGGSNGGLLMGNMLTRRPDLFAAVVAQVPLMDMRRYHQLLAGASWMAEFGNPDDPEDWAFLRGYSPYHNLSQQADYPPLLVTTSTRDDRVHPGHARKMVAKMKDMGHDVTYYENIEGGHGGAADNAQSAFMWALVYEFLWRELTRKQRQSG